MRRKPLLIGAGVVVVAGVIGVVALRGGRTLDGLLPAGGRTFRASDSQGAGQLLAEMLSPLMELPADEWSFDQVVYEVLAR